MKDDKALIATALAQQAHHSPEFKQLANKGLIDFLRQQIVDAEWKIARARTEIEAYWAIPPGSYGGLDGTNDTERASCACS